MLRKTTAAFLIFCILLPFTGCGGSKENDTAADSATSEESTEAEETRLYPELPDADFEGHTFVFLHWNIEGWRKWDDIAVGEMDGEVVNDAVYMRNEVIKDRYNCLIDVEYQEYQACRATYNKVVKAGEDAYTGVYSMGHDIAAIYSMNLFYNLLEIPYLNLSNPWWDQKAVDSLTVGKVLHFVTSDITVLDKSATSCIYFNKAVAADFNISSIYEHIYRNTWTFDKLVELGKSVTADIDGNSVYDDKDRFGAIGGDDPVYMLFHGGGGRYILKDADNYPYIAFNTEKNYSMAIDILEKLMYDEQLYYNAWLKPTGSGNSLVKMFAANQSLFYIERITETMNLRNMEADFGIVPIPKYKEEQEEYGCTVSAFGGGYLSVPIVTGDAERTGILLEALAAESCYTVQPAFYDVVIKDKFTRDAESTDMLDIIVKCRVYDLGDIYGLATFNDNFLRITATGKSDIASFYAKHEKALTKALEKFIVQIVEWSE